MMVCQTFFSQLQPAYKFWVCLTYVPLQYTSMRIEMKIFSIFLFFQKHNGGLFIVSSQNVFAEFLNVLLCPSTWPKPLDFVSIEAFNLV